MFVALSTKYTSKIDMRGNTMRLGSDICQDITLGEITRPFSVSAGHPCACPWQLLLPPWHKHSSCWAQRESQWEHFCLKALQPKVQTAQGVQIHHLQCGCPWSAPWALQGGQCCLFLVGIMCIIWALSLLSPACQTLILQTLPVAAAGEAAGAWSTLTFCLASRRTVLESL